MHRVLRNQLRKISALPSDQDWDDVVRTCSDLAGDETSALPSQVRSFLSSLGPLFERIETTYAQADRAAQLHERSLQLSSEELLEANTRLSQDAETQRHALHALRETMRSMVSNTTDDQNATVTLIEESPTADGDSMDSISDLTALLGQMVEQRTQALNELKLQKFALDQHAIVSATDVSGKIIYANDWFCEISGYSRDQLMGKTHSIVSSGLHDRAFYQDLWRTIAQGRVWNGEICNRTRDGSLFWVAATIVPQPGPNGKPVRYIAIRTDITAQKQLEQALLDSRRFLQNITDSIGEGVFCLDTQGYCTFINPEAERLLGWTLAELQSHGETMHDTVHYKKRDGGHLSMDDCPTTRCLQVGESYHSEDDWFVRRDGTLFPISIASVPMRRNGTINGSVAVFRDITERKRILSALEQSEDRLKVALEAAFTGLWDWNPQTNVAYFSDQWLKMLGYQPGELDSSGQTWRSLLHPDDRDPSVELLVAHMEGHTPRYEAEFRMRHKDGHWVWILASGKVMERDTDGNPVRIAGIHKDITDRKMVEAELARARDAADRANRHKSVFLANMSHEIRTPMNAVIGLSHLALQTDLSARQRDYLEKIHGSSKNLLGILNDILDFSKIEAGRMELESTPFHLSNVLDHLVTVTLPKVREKGLSLDVDQAPDVPDGLIGDPLRLGQVLVNLVSNAVKFTERGQILISVRTASSVNTPDYGPGYVQLQFTIRDTGIGMNDEQIQSLFKPFSQADSSTTRRFGGTGLGLAISRQLVDLMGGEISVSSSPKKGATFTFSVLLQPAPVSTPKDVIPADIKDLAVLVVDDNPTARVIVSNILRQHGFHVDVVGSGSEAIQSVLRKPAPGYGLMIIDWRLPDIDGGEVCRALAAEGVTDLPTLVITAYGADDARLAFQQHAEIDLLEKPITSSRLINAVMKALGQHQRTSDTSAGHSLDSIQGILGAHVLLVEDNAINQQVAREMLEDFGAEVRVASSGGEALTALAEQTFDLVLMDIQMPDMDGYQTTAEIRNTLRLIDLPVVAMTAHTMAGDRERCLDAGMNDHLGKPVDPNALFDVLVRWISPRDVVADQQGPSSTRQIPPRALPRQNKPLPDVIEGIDVKAALRSVNGNSVLLRRLLLDFATGHGTEALILRPMINEGRLNEAQRIAHTLKGTAATIGAKQVAGHAAELETLLRHEPTADTTDQVSQVLDALTRAMSVVIQGVVPLRDIPTPADLCGSSSAPAGGAPAAPCNETVHRLMDGLRHQLEHGNPECEDTAHQLCILLENHALRAVASKLSKAAARFDFAEALEILTSLDTQWGKVKSPSTYHSDKKEPET